MNQDFNINENKINNWLDEIETDRKKIFDAVKINKTSDTTKENKIQSLERLQKALLSYKKLLTKEKNEKEKY